MSFIFENDNLIKSLLQAGQPMQKSAQVNDKVIQSALPSYELALKLLYNLQRDLNDPRAPEAATPIGTEVPNAQVTANVANFRTLGDFLQWAAQNKLTWKGKRFAWTQAEVDDKRGDPNDPTQKAWVFTSLPFDRDDRALDRQPNTVTVYADKDALIEYLSSLRDAPETKGNKVLQFMLATLIGETNGYLRIAGEKPLDTKSTNKPQADINPRLVIDVLPDVLESSRINENLDNHPFQNVNPDDNNTLTVGDLKDEGSFQAWLRGRKVRVHTELNGKQMAQSYIAGATDTNGDPCLAVNILYKRALQLKNVALGDDKTVPNYSKAVNLYLQSVINFGKNIKGKDGQSCAVLQPGTTDNPNAIQTPGNSASGKPGDAAAMTKSLDDVAQYMPLNLSSINLNHIDAFFRAYESMLAGSNSSQERAVKEYHAQVTTAWQNLKRAQIDSSYNFPLVGGAETVVRWLRNPSNTYSGFVHNLAAIVESTFKAISLFYDSYARTVSSRDGSKVSPEFKSIVEGQTPIYESNMRFLNRWLNDANRVQGFKR